MTSGSRGRPAKWNSPLFVPLFRDERKTNWTFWPVGVENLSAEIRCNMITFHAQQNRLRDG
jgi:hypothetical protein